MRANCCASASEWQTLVCSRELRDFGDPVPADEERQVGRPAAGGPEGIDGPAERFQPIGRADGQGHQVYLPGGHEAHQVFGGDVRPEVLDVPCAVSS